MFEAVNRLVVVANNADVRVVREEPNYFLFCFIEILKFSGATGFVTK
jgi:hypothetical protein